MKHVFFSRLIDKYYKLSSPVKASIWFTICNIIQKGIAMITVPIFTRLLTPEQYGVYSVYQSWYSIIVVFATLNLYYGVFNNGMVKFREDRDRYTSTMQGLTTTVTLIFLIIYLLFHTYWNKILGLSSVLVLAMFIELFFAPAYSFWAARERYEFRYKTLVAVTLIMAFASPVLGIISVLFTSTYKAEARVLSFVFVQVCVGAFFYRKNMSKGKCFYNKGYWKYALTFNIPLIPHYLSQSILNQSDRIMIGTMIGKGEAAIYSVAYSVSTLMVLVTSAINNSYIPYTYECLKGKKYSLLKKNTSALIVLVGVGTFFVVAFGPEVIKLFAPAEYYDAIWTIPPVAASVYFMFLYPIFGNVEFYYEENKYVMIASIAGALANVILNGICIPLFGYVAAGYTTLGCYILFSLGHYVFMRKVLKKHNITESIYDLKFFLVFSIVILLGMLGMVVMYQYTIIRYALIVLMIVMVVLKKDSISTLIKAIRKNKQ